MFVIVVGYLLHWCWILESRSTHPFIHIAHTSKLSHFHSASREGTWACCRGHRPKKVRYLDRLHLACSSHPGCHTPHPPPPPLPPRLRPLGEMRLIHIFQLVSQVKNLTEFTVSQFHDQDVQRTLFSRPDSLRSLQCFGIDFGLSIQ